MNASVEAWPPPSLPWQQDLESRLANLWQQRRMPHAICLEGPPGVGKRVLVERLIGIMMCKSIGAPRPCGDCPECHLLAAGHHPDRVQIVPDTPSGRIISIAAARAMIERVSLRPQRLGVQVAVLVPADAMNGPAANAILKTLEEPSADTHLLLLADEPSQLPVTVLSRCLRLSVANPSNAVAIEWLASQAGVNSAASREDIALALEMSGGRPLLAHNAYSGDRLRHWRESLKLIASVGSGDCSVSDAARAFAKIPDESLEALQRTAEAGLAIALGDSEFTQLRKLAHLTSQVQESTLQAAWLAAKQARRRLGSGLRDDLSLAAVIDLVASAVYGRGSATRRVGLSGGGPGGRFG